MNRQPDITFVFTIYDPCQAIYENEFFRHEYVLAPDSLQVANGYYHPEDVFRESVVHTKTHRINFETDRTKASHTMKTWLLGIDVINNMSGAHADDLLSYAMDWLDIQYGAGMDYLLQLLDDYLLSVHYSGEQTIHVFSLWGVSDDPCALELIQAWYINPLVDPQRRA
jgi:hypothetical protein